MVVTKALLTKAMSLLCYMCTSPNPITKTSHITTKILSKLGIARTSVVLLVCLSKLKVWFASRV